MKRKTKPQQRAIEHFPEVLLVGNPNTGKTTLFNKLTSSNEHVGNWHGVTVDTKAKVFDCLGQKRLLVDLPGIYSLSALSFEEQVAIDYIRAHPKTKIINICDLNNIQRNLALTLGLIEFGADVILAVNCMDKRPLNRVDYGALEKELGIPVVEVNADKGHGFDSLKKLVLQPFSQPPKPKYLKKLNLHSIKNSLSQKVDDFFAIKIMEGDESILKQCQIKENKFLDIQKVAEARFDYIAFLQQRCIHSSGKVYGKSLIDKVVLNRFLAFPIFLLVLAGIFYLTFFSLGEWLSGGLNKLLDITIGSWTQQICFAWFGESSWLTHLFCDAIIGGVGTVVGFLPQVGLLFLFLSILEDSGYLSRVAFASEDIFGKIGLSGKSVYTLLMGFGCSTTAVLTARNMEDKNSKIKTALLTPYMSCSAKFPIYVVIGGAFFGASNVFVIMGLYLLGLVVSIILSLIFEKTVLKSKAQSFILEFPPYRYGGVRRVLKVLWTNIKQFLIRVGSLLISMNVIVWLLANFSFDFSFVPQSGKMSMLEGFGKVLAPIFAPLGFGSWGVASALVAGIIAKEVIISSIAMFNGVSNESQIGATLHDSASMVYFSSSASVMSFLVFSLLYLPCISTMVVLSKEIGKKWTFIGIAIQFVVGYLTALFTFNVFRAFEAFGVWPVLGVIFAFIIITASIFKVVGYIKKPKACRGCNGCK